MKKFIFLFLAFLSLSSSLLAQSINYSQLKNRYQSYNGLGLYGFLNQSDPGTTTTGNLSGNLALGGSYFYYMNSDKIQSFSGLQIGIAGSSDSRKQPVDLNLKSNFYFTSTTSFYNQKNNFWGYNVLLTDYFNGEKSNFRSTNNQLRPGIGLEAGKGRIEDLSEVMIAAWLFNELKLKGLLKTEIGTNDIQKLATLIISKNHKRIYDFRNNRMEMLESVSDFLIENGYIESCSIKAFAITNDQVYFASRPTRANGKKSTAGVFSNYSNLMYNNVLQNNTSNTVNSAFNNGIYLRRQVEKVINLRHEISYFAELRAYTSQSNYKSESKVDTVLNQFQYGYGSNAITLNFRYGKGYFPNTRTSFNWYTGITSGIIKQKGGDNSLFGTPYGGVGIYYYFNPQLQLSLNDQVNLNSELLFGPTTKGQYGFNPRNSLNFNLSYALF
jgi:hypothetical protein